MRKLSDYIIYFPAGVGLEKIKEQLDNISVCGNDIVSGNIIVDTNLESLTNYIKYLSGASMMLLPDISEMSPEELKIIDEKVYKDFATSIDQVVQYAQYLVSRIEGLTTYFRDGRISYLIS